jgi:hypothetical protein
MHAGLHHLSLTPALLSCPPPLSTLAASPVLSRRGHPHEDKQSLPSLCCKHTRRSMSSSPHAPLYSSWTTPQLPFLTPYRCQSVVTPNVRRARPPGHVHVVYLSSPPRCTLPFRLGQEKHASTSRTSTDLIPGPPSASHRCRPVPSFCRAPCWRPKTVLSPSPLAAGDARVRPRRGIVPQPRTSPPRSPNKRPPHALSSLPRTQCTVDRRRAFKTPQPPPALSLRQNNSSTPQHHLPSRGELRSSLLLTRTLVFCRGW